jgi:hypothetical protein
MKPIEEIHFSGLVLDVRNHKVEICQDVNAWQSRHISTFRMFQILHTEFKSLVRADSQYVIYSGDTTRCSFQRDRLEQFISNCGQIIYSYSTILGDLGFKAIPDFSFDQWVEVKLPSFFKFYEDFEPSPFDSRSDDLFWIGANTHIDRNHIVSTYGNQHGFDICFSGNRWVSIESHADYKYLLDIRGIGWSARLKYLLLTGSVVFVMDRPDNEYYWNNFIPWVHYVPVSADGSDLIMLLEKIRSDQELAKNMANECRKKALEVFSYKRVFSDFAQIVS